MAKGSGQDAVTSLPHEYLSTACLHDECGNCRNTCKFCDAPCLHDCHPGGAAPGFSWVGQAREIAQALLGACWRVQMPPGTWHPPRGPGSGQ
jgi:hypothetical protein